MDTIESSLHDFWLACGLSEAAWPEAMAAYERYWQLIQAAQIEISLMGNPTREDFFFKHVADSLAVLQAWPGLLDGAVTLADVGCGGGLPGIVLALALPQLDLTAVDVINKKILFVQSAMEQLGLPPRTRTVNRYSRELGYMDEYRGHFDVVVARAVATADKLLRDCRLLIRPGGCCLFYKTPPAVEAELPLTQRDAAKHKLVVDTSPIIHLPGEAGTRQFVRVTAPQTA